MHRQTHDHKTAHKLAAFAVFDKNINLINGIFFNVVQYFVELDYRNPLYLGLLRLTDKYDSLEFIVAGILPVKCINYLLGGILVGNHYNLGGILALAETLEQHGFAHHTQRKHHETVKHNKQTEQHTRIICRCLHCEECYVHDGDNLAVKNHYLPYLTENRSLKNVAVRVAERYKHQINGDDNYTEISVHLEINAVVNSVNSYKIGKNKG